MARAIPSCLVILGCAEESDGRHRAGRREAQASSFLVLPPLPDTCPDRMLDDAPHLLVARVYRPCGVDQLGVDEDAMAGRADPGMVRDVLADLEAFWVQPLVSAAEQGFAGVQRQSAESRLNGNRRTRSEE